jgi:MFS family permease
MYQPSLTIFLTIVFAVLSRWGAAITCGGLLVSWLNDNLGVKKSLCIGFSISMLSSLVVALTFSKTLLYITLFVIYPFGTAMGIPMLTVAVKRYTTAKNRGKKFILSAMSFGQPSCLIFLLLAITNVFVFQRFRFWDVLLSNEYGGIGELSLKCSDCPDWIAFHLG